MAETGSHSARQTLAWPRPRPAADLHALAERLLLACDAALRAGDADWIGHLKALVTTAEGAAYASLTGAGEPVTWRGALREPADRAELTLYAVVWSATDEQVRAAVERAIETIDRRP